MAFPTSPTVNQIFPIWGRNYRWTGTAWKQDLSSVVLGITNGGTGASTAAGARTSLGVAASGVNTDITSINPSGTSIFGTGSGATVQPLQVYSTTSPTVPMGFAVWRSAAANGQNVHIHTLDGSANVIDANSSSAKPLLIRNNALEAIAFSINGAEYVRLSQGGRWLIGTSTDDGVNKLQVLGSATISSNLTLNGNTIISSASGPLSFIRTGGYAGLALTDTSGTIVGRWMNASGLPHMFTNINGGTTWLAISSSGNTLVGAGAVDNSNGVLQINGSTTHSASSNTDFYGTTDQVTNYSRGRISINNNNFDFRAQQGGTGLTYGVNIMAGNTISCLYLSPTGTDGQGGFVQLLGASGTGNRTGVNVGAGAYNASTGTQVVTSVAPSINQSGTAAYTVLDVNPSIVAEGSGVRLLQRWALNGAAVAQLMTNGNLLIGSTTDDGVSKLQVTGMARVNGMLWAGGNTSPTSGGHILGYRWVQNNGAAQSYKVATLPISTSSTFDHAVFEGVFDTGWAASSKTTFRVIAGNRNGLVVQYETGAPRQSHLDIYSEADGSASVWAVLDASTFCTMSLSAYGIGSSGTGASSITFYPNPTSGTPTGTKTFTTSTAVPAFQNTPSGRMLMGSNTDDGVNRLQVTGAAAVSGNLTAAQVTAKGSANSLTVSGSATTVATTLAATGPDTNIDINLLPQGAGSVKINSQPVVTGAFSDTPPASPYDNQLWTDGTSGITYTYFFDGTNRFWVELGPSSAAGTGGTGTGTGVGATGANGDAVFYENDKVVNNSYTITSTRNAMTAGPIAVSTGITVTIPDNCVWTIV